MPTIRETIETDLPPAEAFAFIADFATNPIWDPGTDTAERLNPGPVGVGARYRLGIRMRGNVVPMEYTITTHDAPHRVVLEGEGSGVSATDEITFSPTNGGTRVDYVAEIHLQGLMRLAEPFLGGAFEKIGRQAAHGMKSALDQRARQRAIGIDTADTAPGSSPV